MARLTTEFATRISRALISEASAGVSARSWTPALEQVLHGLGCRNALNPSLVARVIDPFLLTHPSLALGFFNWAAQQPGFIHSSVTYQSVLKSLSLSGQFTAAESLLMQAKGQKLTLDSSVYGLVINSLIRGKKTQNAFALFNEAKSHNFDLGPETCNLLLAALSSGGHFDNAFKVYDEMLKRGVCFSTVGLGVFVWSICSRDPDLDKVLRMLDDVKKGGNSTINGSIIAALVVHGLCKGSRVTEALKALYELRMRDCKPDFIAYRIVTESFRSEGSVADVNDALKMKRKLGVAPRSNDYGKFILGLIKERWINEAKELGEAIIAGNFPIDDDVLNALIGSVSRVDPCSAMLFFDFIIAKGRLPTPTTLINLSRNLCNHEKIDELLQVYNVLSSRDYFSDMQSYSFIFSAFCQSGRVREAYGILQETKKKGLGPDISMYNSLMEACCREDMLRPAKRLWDEMFVTGCGVNLKTYNILIDKFSEIAEVDEALRLFNHMLEKGVAPDATTYRSLLRGLCQETKFEDAIEVFNKSVNQDRTIARSILSSFILNLCDQGKFLVASKLLCGLSEDVMHSHSHVVLLKYLADANEVPTAIQHVKQIQETCSSMLQVIFTELLALLSSSSKPEPILQLLQALSEEFTDLNNNTLRQISTDSSILYT